MRPSPAGLPESALQQTREHVSSLCAQGKPMAALAVWDLLFCTSRFLGQVMWIRLLVSARSRRVIQTISLNLDKHERERMLRSGAAEHGHWGAGWRACLRAAAEGAGGAGVWRQRGQRACGAAAALHYLRAGARPLWPRPAAAAAPCPSCRRQALQCRPACVVQLRSDHVAPSIVFNLLRGTTEVAHRLGQQCVLTGLV